MAKDFGTGVSLISENEGYNYDMVVFQKGKPIMDSEVNLLQQIQLDINQKQLSFMPSGWLSYYPFYTDKLEPYKFYTQNPSFPRPEYALVNGIVVHVTNTGTSTDNLNIIDFSTLLPPAPSTGNRISGVFLEVWRALLDPDVSTNKPDPTSVIDALTDVSMASDIVGWSVGENGLVLKTENGGQTWIIQAVNTKHKLNGVSFPNKSVGWVVGDNGTIARTSNGGALWNVLAVVTPENLTSVSGINQIMAWAVGDNGTALKTINGVNWTLLSTGVTANLRKVHFNINGLVGWATGEDGTIIKTTSGGTSWRVVPSGTTENLNSIYFYDLNYGFAVGDNGTILRTSDGGESWVLQSGNVFDGIQYTTTTNDLHDVIMFPAVDLYVPAEEVTSFFDGTNKMFTTECSPITVGDGRGTTTSDPSYVTVTVDGDEVVVDSMNGSTGSITLKEAPAVGKTVKISYWYKNNSAVFSGWGWIVGQNGMILRTEDIGQTWMPQESLTGYDLNAIFFSNLDKGWAVGNFSVIRRTENGTDTESTWAEQQSDVVVREMQRVYKEGNVNTDVFLFDNIIHPDAAVETTKRVQVQYRIRIEKDVDPELAPDSGLSSNVLGIGPNESGSFGYENMGSVSGDFGLWRAQCLNTVDGYCYAIPMFFVAQRNSTAWNMITNPNGSYADQLDALRPDFLTSEMIVPSDILDVRHQILIPSETTLMENAYDKLLNNSLRTRLARGDTGDVYGSEILQIDRIGGTAGGTLLPNATLADAPAGRVSSAVNLITGYAYDPAYAPPDPANTEYTLPSPITSSGYFPNDPTYFQAVYQSKVAGDNYAWKPLPGYFEGLGTSTVKFIYGPGLKGTDVVGTNYQFSYAWVDLSASGLTYVPANPYLVENRGSVSSVYYNGVNEDSSRVIDEWDSGIPDYRNYVTAYPFDENGNEDQRHRGSPLELHMFMQVPTTGANLAIPTTPVDATHIYNIIAVNNVNNVGGGFSHKLSNQTYPNGDSTVTAVTGYEFVQDNIVEVVASVSPSSGIYNGTAVNFHPGDKSIRNFCKSVEVSGTLTGGVFQLDASAYYGIASIDTLTSPIQHFCWAGDTTDNYQIYPAEVSGLDTTNVSLTISRPTGVITVQAYLRENTLTYQNENTDSLFISYTRNPQQAVDSPPDSVTLQPIFLPPHISISNMGTGGGGTGVPYQNPIEHIAVNDTNISNDDVFNNQIPLMFPNFQVDSGYAERPPVIPGSLGSQLTLSNPLKDNLDRWYYSVCSREFTLQAEGLTQSVPRKIYTPMLCLVQECSDARLVRGEYVMVVFSRNDHINTQNITGFENDSNYVACLYRLPYKPLTRI